MKRVLVTGATGGLGRNAVHALLEHGIEVRATGRNTNIGKELAAAGADFVALDLAMASSAQIAHLLRGVDTIWHCAALSSPWGMVSDFVAANVVSTQRLLGAADTRNVKRFIHISTPAIYFDYKNRSNIPESFRPARYVNAYAQTKAQAEQCVQSACERFPDMRCVILRPRAIFGPYDQVLMPRLSRVLDQRRGRLPLPRGGNVTLDITYVENVVHAMWLASMNDDVPSGAAFNITNHEPVVLREVLQRLFHDELGRPFDIVTLPYPVLAAAARAMQAVSRITGREPSLTPYSLGALSFDMTLDNMKAMQVLHYIPPISLSDGIRRTAEWMRNHG